MARIKNEEEHAAKQNQIIDVAQRLIYTKGYEQMTIQDVLDGTQMSKGAFYHYFASKEALLEAMLDRMVGEVMQLVHPIVYDPLLSALEKLRRYFAASTIWKSERRALLYQLVRSWYADENTYARQKFFDKALARNNVVMTHMIRQGVQEGVLTTPFPDQVGEVINGLFQHMGEHLAALLLSTDPAPGRLEHLEGTIAVYADALERVLGAPPGSLPLMTDKAILRDWLTVPEAAEPVRAAAMAL